MVFEVSLVSKNKKVTGTIQNIQLRCRYGRNCSVVFWETTALKYFSKIPLKKLWGNFFSWVKLCHERTSSQVFFLNLRIFSDQLFCKTFVTSCFCGWSNVISEAAVRRCSTKYVFLKFSQNHRKAPKLEPCLIKFQAFGLKLY